jgi:phage antirepressor YoqD-like protein
MKNLAIERTMTVSEVAGALGLSDEAIRKYIRELYPDKLQQGKATYLTEEEVVSIKDKTKLTTKVDSVFAMTKIERMRFIRQAYEILEDEISILKEQEAQKTRRLNILEHTGKTCTMTELAKELGMKSACCLNKALCDKKIQYRVNDTYVMYGKYSSLGYEQIKKEVLDTGRVIYHRKMTQLGREFILNLFKEGEEE